MMEDKGKFVQQHSDNSESKQPQYPIPSVNSPLINIPVEHTPTSNKRKRGELKDYFSWAGRPAKLDRRQDSEELLTTSHYRSPNNLAQETNISGATLPAENDIENMVSEQRSHQEHMGSEIPWNKNKEQYKHSVSSPLSVDDIQLDHSRRQQLTPERGRYQRPGFRQINTTQSDGESARKQSRIKPDLEFISSQPERKEDETWPRDTTNLAFGHRQDSTRITPAESTVLVELLPKRSSALGKRTRSGETKVQYKSERQNLQNHNCHKPLENEMKTAGFPDNEDDTDELQGSSPITNGHTVTSHLHTTAPNETPQKPDEKMPISKYFTRKSSKPEKFSLSRACLGELAFHRPLEVKVSNEGFLCSLGKDALSIDLTSYEMVWHNERTALLFKDLEKIPLKSDIVLDFTDATGLGLFIELLKSFPHHAHISHMPKNRFEKVVVNTLPGSFGPSPGEEEELKVLQERSRSHLRSTAQAQEVERRGPKLRDQLRTKHESLSSSSTVARDFPKGDRSRRLYSNQRSTETRASRSKPTSALIEHEPDPIRVRRSDRLQTRPQISFLRDSYSPPHVNLGSPWKTSLMFPSTGHRKVTLTFEDLKRLKDEEFLNDNVIEFGIRYAQWMYEKQAEKVYFFNTYFYTALTTLSSDQQSINYDAVRRWTSKVNLFDYNFIVVPINEDLHWYVAIICNLRNLHRDSEKAYLGNGKPDTEIVSDPGSQGDRSHKSAANGNSPDDYVVKDVMMFNGSIRQGSMPLNLEEHMADSKLRFDDTGSKYHICETEVPFALKSGDSEGSPRIFQRQQETPKPERYESPNRMNLFNFDVPRKPLTIEDKPGSAPDISSQTSSVERHRKRKGRRGRRGRGSFDPNAPTIMILDSLLQSHGHVTRNLKDYLVMEAKARYQRDIQPPVDINVRKIPKQSNWCDCGVYLLAYLEKFLKDPGEFVRKALTEGFDGEHDWQKFSPSQKRAFYRDTILNLYQNQQYAKIALSEKPEKNHFRNEVQSPPNKEAKTPENSDGEGGGYSHNRTVYGEERVVQPKEETETEMEPDDAVCLLSRDILRAAQERMSPIIEDERSPAALQSSIGAATSLENLEDDDMLERSKQLEVEDAMQIDHV